jgi:gas vesicle protein
MRETSDPELQILFIESYFKSIKDKIQEQSKLSNANDKKIFNDFIKKLERHINKKIKQIQDQINQDKAPLNEDLEPKSNIITPDSSSMQ